MCTPRAQITGTFEGQPSKTRPFPSKIRVIWFKANTYYTIYIVFIGDTKDEPSSIFKDSVPEANDLGRLPKSCGSPL